MNRPYRAVLFIKGTQLLRRLKKPGKRYNTPYMNNKMRVSVVVPPFHDFYFSPLRFSALGARTVAGLLEKANCRSSLLVFPLMRKKVLPVPEELSYLKEYIIPGERGKLSFFTQYHRFGPSPRQCAEMVLAEKPEIVFISCFAFAYASGTVDFIKCLKNLKPDLLIAAGGAGVSAYPEFFFKNTPVDFIFTGEAEISLPPFIRKFKAGYSSFTDIPNFYRRDSFGITAPDRHLQTSGCDLLFITGATAQSPESVSISTSISRGCPKKCRFCSNFLCHGDTFRKIPITKLIPELSKLPKNIKIDLNFEDDNLLTDQDYFFEVLSNLKSIRPEINFLCENGIDYTLLNEKNIGRLIDFGLKQFNLSIGSINTRLLNNENRPYRFSGYENVLDILDKAGIPSVTYFICGLEGDSARNTANTLLYLADKPTTVGISLFYAVPGIPGFEDREIFLAKSPRLCTGSSAYPWTGSLSTSELITAFRLARFINLVKNPVKKNTEIVLIDKIIREKSLFTYIRKNKKQVIAPVPGMDKDFLDYFFNKADPCKFHDIQDHLNIVP